MPSVENVFSTRWIARELDNIERQVVPRQCKDYEQLANMIEAMQDEITPFLLRKACIDLVQHCQNRSNLRLMALVLELDRLLLEAHQGMATRSAAEQAQQCLSQIVFGYVQLESSLVPAWSTFSDWLRTLKSMEIASIEWHSWFQVGLEAYKGSRYSDNNIDQ